MLLLLDEKRSEEGKELMMVRPYIPSSLPPYAIPYDSVQGYKGAGVGLLQD
jgi:hypothetical protein